MTVKVLVLNDEKCKIYATFGSVYYNTEEFLAEMMKPHSDRFVVRAVDYVNPQGALKDMDEDEFLRQFELLGRDPAKLCAESYELFMERNKIFQNFWRHATEEVCYA